MIVLPEGEWQIGSSGSEFNKGILIEPTRLQGKTVVIVGQGSDRTKLSFPGIFDDRTSWANKAAISFYGGNSAQKKEKELAKIILTQDAPMGSTVLHLSESASLKVGQEVSIGWKITDRFVSEMHGEQKWWRFLI